MTETERIVRDLADHDPPLDGESGYCVFCLEDVNRATRIERRTEHPRLIFHYPVAPHAPTCPWRRAMEYVGRTET